LLVKKLGGGVRFYVDYRKLNAITTKDCYLLLLIKETLARISKVKIFTKIDIRQAFYRLRIAKGHKDLTTFRIRYRAYRYIVMPFGLINSPASF